MKKNTNNSNNKNVSARRKLIPAVAMLATSAAMLSTSTYAWFTMSKEVEVTGINMTATVPENLQVSVGEITAGKSLNAADSYVTDNTKAPTDENMWSNMLVLSQYYSFGKLIPASSTNGLNIFFTPDATVVGKTVASDAEYIQAAAGLSPEKDTVGRSYMATLHSNTADTWTATGANTYDKTNDDGYYVDVPIWFRTSSKTDVNLSVEAYVGPGPVTTTNNELYKAARVVIIDPSDTSTSSLIPLKDSKNTGSDLEWNYYGRTATGKTADSTTIQNAAVAASGTYGGDTSIYAAASYYTSSNKVCTVSAAGSDAQYGEGKKIFARIWLEGEDQDCWNKNAGQDFTINLKFNKIETS